MSSPKASEFIALVQSAFSADGVLARGTTQFQPREGQTQMAFAVARTIESGGSLVVEAGTGVGKTFAYLIPALLSGERVLLSTATKALQDQLFARDLPQLLRVLKLPLRTALLKGRSSYLCQQRLQTHAREQHLGDASSMMMLSTVRNWSRTTSSGDLAELGELEERSALWPLITSTRENCLGAQCPEYKACFVNAARKQALSADVVVINHHLFFADLAVKESGMAELLPSVRVVVFDEAHQLNETGTQFLGEQFSVAQLLDFVRDLLACGLGLAAGLCDWQLICGQFEKAVRDFRLCLGNPPTASGSARLRWTQIVPDGVDANEWLYAFEALDKAFTEAGEALGKVIELAPEFSRLQERLGSFKGMLKHFSGVPSAGQVRWVELGAMARLVDAPLDIARVVKEKMLGLVAATTSDDSLSDSNSESTSEPSTKAMRRREGLEQEAREHALDSGFNLPRSWVFTSATLGEDESLSWFTGPCGLQSSEILKVQSPFNYPEQALLFIPKTMVKPSDPTHSQAVTALAVQVIDLLGGRTLVLTTTNRAMKAISAGLSEHYASQIQSGALEVLVQGQLPKRFLMERFRGIESAQGTPLALREAARSSGLSKNPFESSAPLLPLGGCVLVATASFWEGFDVPGDALQAVIIDKLPFPPPTDPLVEARCNRIEQAGGSAFNEYSVPEVAVALKQGAGRLIRRESDRGALVICDSRLMSTGYGRRLIKSLPPMRHEQRIEGLLEFLSRLGKSDVN